MTLSEYEKIPSDFKGLMVNESEVARLNKLVWCATEKIHGANFRFIYRDKKLLFGKRKALLNWNDDFFGFQIVAVGMETRIIALFEQLARDFREETIIIYGELFGGSYPHPDVPANPEVEAIQTGIYYAPDIHFCAYDIAFEVREPEHKVYLSYKEAINYFTKFGILHAKPLRTGKLPELLNMDLRMESQIPDLLRLPKIEGNIIEGVVIKPFDDLPADTKTRPILKLKNPEFEENTRFHEAQKWSFIPDVKLKSEELDFILEDLYDYITPNRMNSAISKTGKLNSEKRRQEIEEEFLSDVLDDFNLTNHGIWAELNTEQKLWLSDRVVSAIRRLMR